MSLVLCTAMLVCQPITAAEIDAARQLLTAAGVQIEFKALAIALSPSVNVITASPSLTRDGFE